MGKGQYENLVVQITGAASGFGRLAAHRFAREGAHLALSDVNSDHLEEVADELRSKGHRVITALVDVTSEEAVSNHVRQVVEEYGQLDVAINNAGKAHPMTPLQTLKLEVFEQMLAVNTRGCFLGLKYQIPAMLERGSGAILNVASVAGLVGAGYLSAYSASKHAIIGLTRSAADEVASKGVRVNALCPAFSPTPLLSQMTDQLVERHGVSEEDARGRLATRIPMKRTVQPEEVVETMIWICSPMNSAMTGQAIAVDGGLTAI